jgi:hypothetical protein
MSVAASFQFYPIPTGLLPQATHYLIQAAAWFQSQLYLGISCYPADPYQAGTALLLRHRLGESAWDIVHSAAIESRWVFKEGHYRLLPLELGWRILAVLPGKVQPTPVLYAIKLSRQSTLLHSDDGTHFQESPNLGSGCGPLLGFRSFSGKVFAMPVSASRETGRHSALCHVADSPLDSTWQPACSPGFDEVENRTLDGLHVAYGHLYAALGNPLGGFQLWKTTARGEPPFAWEPVLTEGAQRYTLNPHIETMTVFKDALYLGTRSPQPDPNWEFATSGAEIIRVLGDGHWELVMGTPRFSPIGLQVPLSTHGPGFGEHRNGFISRLASTPDALYAAIGRYPDTASRSANGAGFGLWRTADAETWDAITQDSFGCPAATNLRILQPTPQGLVAAGDWDLTDDTAAQPGVWLEQP